MTTDSTSAPDPSSPSVDRTRLWCVLFVIAAALSPLIYALVTDHVWEDYLITFRVSRNLVLGNGLVFSAGERVQGSTSPLGTLLPAFFYWLMHVDNFKPAMWLFRITSIAAFATAGSLAFRLMLQSPIKDRLAALFFTIMFVTEAKAVAFTVNGQECAFMMMFIAMAFWAAYHGIAKHWTLAGLAWAGLQWTRPDGCVYIASLGLVGLMFAREARRDAWIGSFKAAGICTVVYLPWFLYAWSFYGNPIPHTIIAKGVHSATVNFLNPLETIRYVLSNYPMTMVKIYQPIYGDIGGWPPVIMETFTFCLAAVASTYWAFPNADRLGRMASILFSMMLFYMSFVGMTYAACPWYLPAIGFLGLIAVSRAIHDLASRIPGLPQPAWVSRPVQVFLVLSSLFFMVGTIYQMRIQQREIEEGVRMKIGLWLHDVMKPQEVLFLEPLGYIGYYSQAPRIYDFPGLVAPEVVRVRKVNGHDNMASVVMALWPDWMVLRPLELETLVRFRPISESYAIVQVFDAKENLDKIGYIPGSGYVRTDSKFFVLRKLPGAPPVPVPANGPSSN